MLTLSILIVVTLFSTSLQILDPQKPDPWKETRKVIQFANPCPQLNYITDKLLGNEDCLHLNVFTKTLDANANNPVIVWIPGGGFLVGGSSVYGPEYIMDQKLVLVTFDYRLSALGFMHLDDKYLTSNYGMKDQRMVLKWVQDNIHLFGGNPKLVTLAGSDTGAMSANWHMYSPGSKGLFHQVILQSGTARSLLGYTPRNVARYRARSIAIMAGCAFKQPKETLKCLQKLSIARLFELQKHFEIWKQNGFFFGVVIESSESEDPFVTISPWTDIPLSGNIPIMIGYTSDETGLHILQLLETDGAAIKELGERYQELLPILLMYQFNVGLKTNEAVLSATEKIKKLYFNKGDINIDEKDSLKRMLADYLIIYETIETLINHKKEKYFYVYSHRNEDSFAQTEFITETEKSVGPVHSDDLISLFKLSYFRNELSNKDLKVSKLMISLWASFATHGHPNFDRQEPYWNIADDNLAHCKIEYVPYMKRKWYWEKRYAFWKSFKWPLM